MRYLLLILLTTIFITSCDLRKYHKIEAENLSEQKTETAQEKIVVSDENISEDISVITHIVSIKTNMGEFTLGLFGNDAPETVANFIGLAKLNYYRGLLFHRVAKNFLIQTGDRNTLYESKKDIWGFGGESFYGGDIADEINPKTPSYKMGYVKGTVAMANRGPNTNSSQFFICLDEAKELEHKWTIFGKVLKGINVVEDISRVPVEPSERGINDGIPLKPVRILNLTVKLNS